MSYCNVCKETMLSEWPHVHEPPGEQAHVHESLAATGTMLDERSDEITALRARLERVEGAAREARGILMELNPNNYDHDDVCAVNAGAGDAAVALDAALAPEPEEPKP